MILHYFLIIFLHSHDDSASHCLFPSSVFCEAHSLVLIHQPQPISPVCPCDVSIRPQIEWNEEEEGVKSYTNRISVMEKIAKKGMAGTGNDSQVDQQVDSDSKQTWRLKLKEEHTRQREDNEDDGNAGRRMNEQMDGWQ